MIKVRNTNMSKKSKISPVSIETNLTNNQRLLPKNDFNKVVNEAEVYNEERLACNKVRIILTLNPLCSNVLFNRITEVVKNEGSDNCLCLNYGNMPGYLNNISDAFDEDDIKKWEEIGGKPVSGFNREENSLERGASTLTRDTSLTAEGLDVDYKCGIDIFNNHLLRSKSFKIVCDTSNGSIDKKSVFNTLFDFMREGDGKQVYGYTLSDNTTIPLHLYLKEDVMNFDEAVDKNLDEENGWIGFINRGKILTYTSDPNDGDRSIPINRIINNRPACSFVDLCPDRSLWYFTPKFNKSKNRFEKNWNYCLTYPQSSTTNVSFIRQQSNSLKVYYFDDTVTFGGTPACKLVSFCKHGLQNGDIINLYINGSKNINQEDRVYTSLKVIRVEDEYSFYVNYSATDWIYDTKFITWNNSFDFEKQIELLKESDKTITADFEWNTKARKTVKMKDGDNTFMFPVFVDDNNMYKCNLSNTSDDISFKQVYNSEEVQYYVRIFSKIPNWKYAEEIPSFRNSDEIESMIEKYSSKKYDFESTLSKLAFSKNAYGDEISQIVFNDDIDISDLTDNLGRPVTDIYFTLLKNNMGYREWYGKENINIATSGDTIEYSHVFGKLTCAFELSPKTVMNPDHQNIVQINNISGEFCCNGLNVNEIIHEARPSYINNDEIEFNRVYDAATNTWYDGDIKFYGDLCLYSPATVAELVIDDIWYRFNTAQRELTPSDKSYAYLNNLAYDEILHDDYDSQEFQEYTDSISNACISQEGYKYKPHYRIPIKSFSRDLFTATPHIVDITNVDYTYNETEKQWEYTITTNDDNYNELNDNFVIFNKQRDEYYIGTAIKIISSVCFKCTLYNDNGNEVQMFDDVTYKFIRKQETIPSNARLLRDGSLLYVWREIYQNGFDGYSTNEVYPFTNGAFYIEKDFRVFVKRQDPDKLVNTITGAAVINDVEPVKMDRLTSNEYYNEMNCFTDII